VNEYDNLTISGTVSMHPVTSAISKLEKDVAQLQTVVLTAEASARNLRAQLDAGLAAQHLLRTYIEYLNPADAPRPVAPMSYADWLKLQAVSDQIVAAA
jgi:hypothetical protein